MISNQQEIWRSIVAIVRVDTEDNVRELLGTGFFVGQAPRVLTARHVVADATPGEDGRMAVAVVDPREGISLHIVNGHTLSKQYDLAALKCSAWPAAQPLRLSGEQVDPTEDILMLEYSATRFEELPDGHDAVIFSPFTHKGNALRHYSYGFPTTSVPAFDTSFPAMQGASGAPVIRANDFTVVGMMFANHERHLLPAQVVRAELDGKNYEEIRYYLPTGLALEGSILVDFVRKLT